MSKNNEIERIEYKGYAIVVYPDNELAESPREWSNLGTMTCWHNRYNLGDIQPKDDPSYYMAKLIYDNGGLSDDQLDSYYEDSIDEYLLKAFDKYFISLPLYLYDHSGITMSTSNSRYPFNDVWDSGQVGFIFVSKQSVKKEYGWKHLTNKRINQIVDYLKNEVKTYDDYLTGNVYGYAIYEIPEDEDIDECDFDMADSIDSCWGYFGDYDDYMLSECKSIIDHMVDKKKAAIKIEHDSIFSINPLYVGI